MEARAQPPGGQQVHGVVEADLDVLMGTQRIAQVAAEEIQPSHQPVHHDAHLHAPVRRVQQGRGHGVAALVVGVEIAAHDERAFRVGDQVEPGGERLLARGQEGGPVARRAVLHGHKRRLRPLRRGREGVGERRQQHIDAQHNPQRCRHPAPLRHADRPLSTSIIAGKNEQTIRER